MMAFLEGFDIDKGRVFSSFVDRIVVVLLMEEER